ncbi:rod shape-determining protein MreC [Candidatus Sumerlaeota bacterium]|nr:rod shape-determining protein MreC [Candidatus Sumerlaeota bacterium]
MKLFEFSQAKQYIVLGALVLFGLLLLLHRQQERLPDNRAVRVMLFVTSPPLRALTWVDTQAMEFWEQLFHAGKLQTENEKLRLELARVRMERDLLREETAKLESVNQLIPNTKILNTPIVAANIIAFSADQYTHSIKIDRGANDGVRENLPVINHEGLIGIVITAGPNTALVRLTIDDHFAIASMLRETRLQGHVQGTGRPGELQFHFDDIYEQIEPEQEVITSGMAGAIPSLLPKGLLIGRIERLELGVTGQPFAIVRPAANADRLEQVVVMILPQE